MQLNLKISQRGFLLVSIPLVFELIFVFVLTQLISHAEAEMQREAHAKDVVRCIYKLQKDMLDCATAAISVNLTGDTISAQRFPLAYKWVQKDLDQLSGLIGQNPKQIARLTYARAVAERNLRLFDDLKNKHAEEATVTALIGSGVQYSRMRSMIGQLGGATRDIIEEEERILAVSPVLQSQQRARVQQALTLGVGLNIILAVVMAMFFSRSITKRLETMSENSRRVARSDKLLPPVEGTDEIAQLDTTFHKMVEDLRAAELQKKQLVQTVSHDLRTPLTSVRGILALLSAGAMGILPEKAIAKIEMAESDLERLIRLINDLLDLEKMSSGGGKMEFADIPAKRLIERSFNSVAALAEEKQLNVSRGADRVELRGDEDRLMQVLVNLLSNAIKFSPDGGEIEIEAEHEKETDGTAMVKVTVADRGRGVPAGDHDKIFERFSQLESQDAVIGGSGLGLAICKSIIELHAGSIGVEAREGGGSIFWFKVPASKAAPLA